MPSQRGWLNILWPFLVGVGLLLFFPAMLPVLAGVLIVLVFYMIGLGLQMVVDNRRYETQRQKTAREAAFDYWFYHRATDTWIPANGPHSYRAWWSSDWNRWLTKDEIEGRIPFTTGFNVRLKVFDDRNRVAQVWRDQCEVWTIYPATGKRIVTSIARDKIDFMTF
jgi:hypothetical protein